MRRPIDIYANGVSIGQGFGADPEFYKKYNLAGHHAVDYPAPVGTPVVAPEAGVVTQSANNVKDQYTGAWVAGETIVVRGMNHEHWLLHLNSRIVAAGQTVTEGQVLGYSGNTGVSFGPHLHWGVRPNTPNMANGYRGFIDPAQVLGGAPAPAPAPKPSGNTVTLPAHVQSWAIYHPNSAFRKGTSDQLGTLLPAKFGGLTYDILGWVGDKAVIIQTNSFGRGAVWVRDTDAVISSTAPAPVIVPPTPPVYHAPSAPINISSPKYGTIVKDIPGYISANAAANHLNPVTTVKAGSDYYVFTNKYGMDNVTLVSGQPGAWINPTDNVPDPPEPVIVPVEEPKRTQEDIKKDWTIPPVAIPAPIVPTPTPEPETPDYQAGYHKFDRPVWYKAVEDTFVQDMATGQLISLSVNRELPIHGTFTKDSVLYGRATKKNSTGWFGVPLNDLTLAATPVQKLEKVGNTVLKDPVFIDSARPTFDKLSQSIHATDLFFDRAFKVFDVFRPRKKK